MTNEQYKQAVSALALMFATIKPENISTEAAVSFLQAQFNVTASNAFDVVRDALTKAGF